MSNTRSTRLPMSPVWQFALLPILILAFATPVRGQDTTAVPPNMTQDDPSLMQIQNKYPEIQAAVNLFVKRDFEGASMQMKRAKEKHPELPPAGVMMGTLFQRANDGAMARNEFEKAVRDEPNDPEAFVVFGDFALRQRFFTDAGLLYEKAAAIAEGYSASADRKANLLRRALFGTAQVARARDDWKGGEAAMRKQLVLKPDDYEAHLQLGEFLFRQDKETDAYTMFQEAYRLDKAKVARAEVNMAKLFQSKGDDARAKQLMDLAKDRDPKSLPTRLAIAQWAYETNRIAYLEESAKVALELDPNNFDARYLQGLVSRVKKDLPAAEKAFFSAHEASPSNGLVLNQLAVVLAEQKDEKKKQLAAEFSQMANKLFGDRTTPLGRESMVVLGWVLYQMDRLPQADQVIRQALQSGGVGDDSAYFAARILHDAGNGDAALQLLNASLDENKRLFPNRENAQELRAKILAGGGTSTKKE